MTPQKRAALRRATEFAQGIAGSTAEVAAASASAGAGTRDTLLQAPSRDELEYLRPRAEPRVNGGRYVRLHQKLFDSIDAAFVRAQLVALAEGWVDDEDVLRPIRGVRRLPKADIVQAIMDRWGWVKPVPLEVVKPRTQGENNVRSIKVPPFADVLQNSPSPKQSSS
jgi:hypothetical protein